MQIFLWNAYEDYHTPPAGMSVYIYTNINQRRQSELVSNLLPTWSILMKTRNLMHDLFVRIYFANIDLRPLNLLL